MAKYSIIDADTHITEPADLFTSRVPKSMVDKVPHVIPREDGYLTWVIGNSASKMLGAVGTSAVAGIKEGLHTAPKGYDGMHPGACDARERVKYMDQQGIWAMVMYPNVAGFGNHHFLQLKDRQLMLACVQAYNDFQTEWAASADARRLLPVTSIPIWDVEASVTEIRRCYAMGHRGILFTGGPHAFGLPYMGDPYWNPLWEVACELNLPISFHIGSGGIGEDIVLERAKHEGQIPVFTALGAGLFLQNGQQLADLIMSGVLIRYPTIKFVSVESGIGWIPFTLEALDYAYYGMGFPKHLPQFDMLPSEYYKRNVYACYWFEEIAPRRLFDTIGVDNIMFETDFPHPICLYGEEVWERINKGLGECPEPIRRKILFENAQKLYRVEAPTARDEALLDKVIGDAKPFWRAA